MADYIKNMDHETALFLAGQIACQPGQITSKTLAQGKYRSLTLFAFDENEEISTHDSAGDALVLALEGEARIVIGEKEHILKSGEAIIMPAKIPHSIYALKRFKMLLIVIFSEK